MYTRNNKIAPVTEHNPNIVADGNATLNGKDDKPWFQGAPREKGYCQNPTIKPQLRNGKIKVTDSSFFCQNASSSNSCVTHPPTALNRPNKAHIGLEYNSLHTGIATIQNVLPRHLGPAPAHYQKGNSLSQRDSPMKTDGFNGQHGKNRVVPFCPSCQQPTVQVFLAEYNNMGIVPTRDGQNVPMPSMEYQGRLLKANAPTKSTMSTCSQCLKCFSSMCPSIKGNNTYRQCYVLSVICWLTVILTIIIVIATTLYH